MGWLGGHGLHAGGAARHGNLARRFLIGFMVATLPGMAALGAVTYYSIRSLTLVHRQLDEITLSLEATRDLHLAIMRVGKAPSEYLLRHPEGEEQEFKQALGTVEDKLAACASAACHAASKTPRQMAALLKARVELLRVEGGLVFKTSHSSPADSWQLERIDRLVGGTTVQLGEMSDALVRRVRNLRTRAEVLNRQASLLTSLAALAVLGFGCASALALAKRVSRPVENLLVGTRRVRAGDWNYRVEVLDGGEIGELAGSFNAMLDEVRRHRDQLREYGRLLEERVRQRSEELKRRDMALRESEKLASVGLLAAGVAHELNNPLTSILMNANLMMEDVGPASPLFEDLKKIDTDAGRCKRIIDDLRTFSRPRNLQLAPCRVELAIEQALKLAEPELASRAIRVETRIAPDLPQVRWDRERITQVLVNLFVNAAQAMEDGGTLTVDARTQGESITLEVRDNGHGIPPHYRSRILEPFFTTKPTGTGLGLSISYGIVQEHGGSITMDSLTREEAGPAGTTGTTVRISLPVSAPEERL